MTARALPPVGLILILSTGLAAQEVEERWDSLTHRCDILSAPCYWWRYRDVGRRATPD
jgi:hypothetical protein